ncbi:CDK5 and ABL1 enzyme substrate 1 [Entomortierella chlamydospora]|uniref:CDK5 and ABL1 enzyme substrate 1 n=1 Tax=Entomortierella chlamydospora TaxID=101097 RepID=A0A9P6N393_9FUNG|nr:CDK5 and ABL1 enzyme substrate 1 [Entomortierella chlamydospora]
MDPVTTQNQPSPAQRSVRRRGNANRQAAFSFLSSIQLDPTPSTTTQPQAQAPTSAPLPDIAQQFQDVPLHTSSKPYDSPLTSPLPSLNTIPDRQKYPLSPTTPTPTTPTTLRTNTTNTTAAAAVTESRRSQAFGKKDEAALSFLSTIRLHGNSINDQDPIHIREQMSSSGEPTASQRLNNEQYMDAEPSSPSQGDLVPYRPISRSCSSPSLVSSWAKLDGDNMQESTESGHTTRYCKITSPGAYPLQGSQLNQCASAASNGNSTQVATSSGLLSTLLARDGDSETQSPSSEMGMVLSRRYNLQKSSNRWLVPLTDHVYIKPLIASGTIVKKIFRRPSISIPKYNTSQSQTPGSQSSTIPRQTLYRSQSTLQTKNPLDSQRHIFYKGEQLAYSCVSLGENLSQHAFMFTTKHGSPLMVSSILKYNDDNAPNKRRRRRFDREYLQQITKEALVRKKANSFAPDQEDSSSYDPYYLDDPELKTGKNRTVISLACYMGSVIQYTRPSDLKRELNEHFRSRHPTIDPSITLSKIRKVKTDLLAISEELDLEISTTALAFAYFEKLVMKGNWKGKDSSNLSSESTSSPVTKENRKLIASYKVNEPKRPSGDFGVLMKQMTKYMDVAPKDIKEHEFQVFSLLEFNLYLPRQEFLPHFERILYRQGKI